MILKGLLAFALTLALVVSARAASAEPTPDETLAAATDAYIYGYPLVTMEITRRVMTNTTCPSSGHAPMGQFYHARRYPDPSFHDVTAPNADTLYSTAWLDLSHGPYVFTIPDMGQTYYLFPMLDAYTNVFASVGSRTTGQRAQSYLITGPNWTGGVPAGMVQIKAPTNLVWVLGRTYCTGTPADFAAVHKLQNQYRLTAFSEWGKPRPREQCRVDTSIDARTPVRDQVNALSAPQFFELLTQLMKSNPPPAADAPMLTRMKEIGLLPWPEGRLCPADLAQILQAVPQAAQQKIAGQASKNGVQENGWRYSLRTGSYGTDYLNRASVAWYGLGANVPQDAVYLVDGYDAAGHPLTGANNFALHFAPGQTPPVNGFWSLTLYSPQYFFVPNALSKYTVSPRNDLKYNADGSLDLYVQTQSPGREREPNWLPAPRGNYLLMLRLYWPKEPILSLAWKPEALASTGVSQAYRR